MIRLERLFIVLVLLVQGGFSIKAQTFTFGMFTDVHYAAIPDRGTRKYTQSLEKLDQCIDTMNKVQAGFLIELGDFKDMSVPADKNAVLGFLETIENAFSRFPGDRYHVLGNHDEDCISKKEFSSIAANTIINADSTWYAFQKGGYRFIVLDACYDSAGRSYNSGSFDWKDANIPDSELKWLDNQLNYSKLPIIVFVHQLLYGDSAAMIHNAGLIRTMLEKSNKVKCVFHGHEHSGGYEQINGIHYYTLRGMIEGNFPDSNSFAVVTLEKDKILIRGYGNAISKNLPLK
jgi:alkaline phosphatase